MAATPGSAALVWSQATSAAPWSGRRLHTAVPFDGRMWVIGGFSGSPNNDVWHSADGAVWTAATTAASWARRHGHTSVVFDGRMWLLGGRNDSGQPQSDVRYSTNGANWTTATGSAPDRKSVV